jgi:ABC-type bacteriocin/lantibiotic exporter with double-glycine peptidase domain
MVAELPEGIDNVIGGQETCLFGGQQQFGALARAFYHALSVLVLDEATSALYKDTEKEIVEEIRMLKGKKAMFVIAHRYSAVQHCDLIGRLNKGKIAQAGEPMKK